MGIKKLTPTSPARRYQTYLTRDELTVGAVPEKSLLEPKKRISGRNNDGHITVRRRGGGHKRFYRVIDSKRDKDGVPFQLYAFTPPGGNGRWQVAAYSEEGQYLLAFRLNATSKAALASLTREMAHDFGALGIRVNAIAPGEIDTAILSPGTEKIVAQIPLHRLGTPDEVAKIIYVLCTETSSYVNGAEIHINGGQHV